MVRPCSESHRTQCERSRARSVCKGSRRIQGGNKQPSGGEGPDPPTDIFVFFLLLPILEEAHQPMNFLGLL